MRTLTKKRLALTITLGTGEFGDTVGSTATVTGLRMSAEIVNVIGNYQGTMQLRAYGLSPEMMNKLTTIGPIATAMLGKNKVLLAAGDDVDGMSTIYEGSIINAWGDYNSAPDVAFNLLAQAGAVGALKPILPLSPGEASADVAQMMSTLAKEMGLGFENSGVTARMSYPYFDRSGLAQLQAIASAADVEYTIDRGTLAIWPRGGTRAGDVLVSPTTGMIGYPSFSSQGISITTLFDRRIKVGNLVQVESSLAMARGGWKALKVSHSLSSEMPGGPWFTKVEGWNVKN
jgi:hypothetical protein